MTEILRTRGLSVSFGGLHAVQNISMSVTRGEVLGLLGPNGAGKTTLLNLIAGVTLPTFGEVSFDGEDISKLSVPRRARRGIARTFQITQPFHALTVRENVMVGGMLKIKGKGELLDQADELLEYVGLSAKRDMLAESLSTGQRKRLELARALAIQPKLLLMDEVTGGVDQPSIPGLVKLVASLADRGITVVIIEHNMRIISELCNRVLFMSDGAEVAIGAPSDVLSNPAVVEMYLGGEDLC